MTEEFFLQSNGGGRLHCACWKPEGEIRAVVQLIHGIAEHICRYEAFAGFLASQGYLVVAEDHMGHGGSVEDTLGYFQGGWMTAVADVDLLREHVQREYALPYCMLGHSMGSFLLRTYLYTYPDSINAAILSGTGWEAPAKLRAGLLACRLEARRLGEKQPSPLLTDMMFGAYTKPFRPVRTPNDWISSVESVVDEYTADPLCGFAPTVGLCRDMLTGMLQNEQTENLEKMRKELPVLFVSGGKDPVGAMGAGVLKCIDAFKRAGMSDVSIRIYPDGRHEMLNESNKEEVYCDILAWLGQKT